MASFWSTAGKIASPAFAVGSMFKNWDGSQSRGDLARGRAESQGYLDQGRTAGLGHITAGRDGAVNRLMPYIESGQRGQTAYENTLGLNGDEARTQQFGDFQSDPALAARSANNQLQMNQLMRKYNAGGQGVNSGAAVLGTGRLATEQFDRDWGDYRNRLMGVGQQGQGAATQAGNWEYGAGKDMADLEMNFANTSAGNSINYANAMAASRNAGLQNMLNVAGTAAKFMPWSMGR